jgi:hypothetical protein
VNELEEEVERDVEVGQAELAAELWAMASRLSQLEAAVRRLLS